ncbi:unnamed protein product [Protopolystoma xenopodis]|uniref:Uncharacterized protein n=1 Tax=Protopolystoma xenopodis TaxID=117903 RepID=A0A3S5A2V3_9PLAT|nr:unnamed protein product [Protopolystoma xenopodis]
MQAVQTGNILEAKSDNRDTQEDGNELELARTEEYGKSDKENEELAKEKCKQLYEKTIMQNISYMGPTASSAQADVADSRVFQIAVSASPDTTSFIGTNPHSAVEISSNNSQSPTSVDTLNIDRVKEVSLHSANMQADGRLRSEGEKNQFLTTKRQLTTGRQIGAQSGGNLVGLEKMRPVEGERQEKEDRKCEKKAEEDEEGKEENETNADEKLRPYKVA